MKKTTLFDILFMATCCIILVTLTELGYSNIGSNYSFVFILIAYFAGKYVRGMDTKAKSN